MVRLPVAHCELNPIEMAWSQVKGHVKDNNKKYEDIQVTGTININTFARFTLTEVKELVYEGFGKVTPEKWQSLVNHTEKLKITIGKLMDLMKNFWRDL